MKATTTIMRMLSILLLQAIAGTALAFATGWDPATTTCTIIGVNEGLGLIGFSPMGSLNTITITASTILDEFNQYYIDQGQNQNDILRAIKRRRGLSSLVTQRTTRNDVVMLSQSYLTQLLQPFHKNYQHKGDLTLRPNEGIMRQMKIDTTLYPDDLENSFFAFLGDERNGDRSTWPATRFYWEEEVPEQLSMDHAIVDWAGEYEANDGGAAKDRLKSYDGLKKLATDGLAHATRPMNSITLSEDPTDPTKAFDCIEEVAGQLKQNWKGLPVDIIVSEKFELNYFRDRRNSFDALESRAKDPNAPMTVDGRPNWRIVTMGGIDEANDHGWIIVTPRPNLLHYTKIGEGAFRFDMQKADRGVKIMADWKECLMFGVNEHVYVFNPDASASS